MAVGEVRLETRVNPHSGKKGRTQYRVGSKGKFFDTEAEAIKQYNRHNPNKPFSSAEQARLSNGLANRGSYVNGELHPSLNGKGVTSANFTTTYGNLAQLRAQAPLGNIAPEIPTTTDFTTHYGNLEQLRRQAPLGNVQTQQYLNYVNANQLTGDYAVQNAHNIGTNQNPITNGAEYERMYADALNKQDDARVARREAQQAESAARKGTKGNVTAYNPNTGKYESVTPERAQRLKAQMEQTRPAKGNVTALNPETGKYESVTPERAQELSKKTTAPKTTAPKTTGKGIGKFFNGKGLKGKAGWLGLAALAIGVGTAIYYANKDDKKVEDVKPEETSPVEEKPVVTDEKTEEEKPAAPVVEEPEAQAQPEDPAYEPIVKLNDDGTYTTKKNDNFYALAENLLKDYCAQNNIDKVITNKSPEVQILAERIMRKNEYWYDPNCTEANKRYSAPMLYPNVTLNMVEFNDLVKKAEEVKEEVKAAA